MPSVFYKHKPINNKLPRLERTIYSIKSLKTSTVDIFSLWNRGKRKQQISWQRKAFNNSKTKTLLVIQRWRWYSSLCTILLKYKFKLPKIIQYILVFCSVEHYLHTVVRSHDQFRILMHTVECYPTQLIVLFSNLPLYMEVQSSILYFVDPCKPVVM